MDATNTRIALENIAANEREEYDLDALKKELFEDAFRAVLAILTDLSEGSVTAEETASHLEMLTGAHGLSTDELERMVELAEVALG